MIKELFKDMGKYLPSLIVPSIIGFISIPILTRLFSPIEYGNYTLVLSTITLLTTIIGWVSISIIRFYPVYERDAKLAIFYGTVLKWLFISVFVIAFLCLTILLMGRTYIPTDLYKLLLIGLGVFIFLSFFQTLLDFFRAKRLVSWYTSFSIFKNITAISLGLILVMVFKFRVEGLLLGLILSILLAFPLLWKKIIDKSYLKERGSNSLALKMAKFSIPVVIGNLAYWILTLSDRYILSFFRGAQEVGVYSASYGIGEKSILLIVSLFTLSSTPVGMSLWEGKRKNESRIFVNRLTRYFLIVCFPAAVGLSILSKAIIGIFVGINFFEGYRVFPFVVSSIFINGLSIGFGLGLGFYEKTKYIMWTLVVGCLANLGLNLIFVPAYGYMAAAITTFVGYVVMLGLKIYFSRKFFVWKFPFRTLGKVFFSSMLMGLAVYWMNENLVFTVALNMILIIGIGVLIYFSTLFFLREIEHGEKEIIKEALKGLLNRKSKRIGT